MQNQIILHARGKQSSKVDDRALVTYDSIAKAIKQLALKLKSLRLLSEGIIPNKEYKNDYQYIVMDILELVRRSCVNEVNTKYHPVRITKLLIM